MNDTNSKNNYSGCFATIAIICAVIVGLYIIGQIFKAIGKQYEEDSGSVIGGVFLIGLVAFVVYKSTQKK